MKKISILFLLVLLPLIASAYMVNMVKINDIYYNLNVNDYTASVTSNGNILGGSYTGTVIIPEKIKYTVSNKSHVFYVRSIGAEAFYNSSVWSVKIPYTVTSIDGGAFRGCSNLTSVDFYGVTSIGSEAFYGCSSLISITIPQYVTSIGDNAFDGCCNLRSVIVSALNTKYDSRDDCNAIIETATNTLIVGCYNTVIPNSVTSIGSNAFNGCSGLKSVTIPNSVTSIGSNAFNGCSGLKSVSIGNSVTSIGSYAFSDCSGLTSVTIPNSVTSIGSYAFSGCSGLKSVSIGNSVTSIGYYAFKNCSGLTSVEIPNSVTSIGDDAFDDCSGLTQVTLNSNDIVSKSYSSTSTLSRFFGNQVKAYILGNSVTSIGSNAFYNCSGLTSVTIPQSVTSIGSNAFYNCSGLTSIEIPNSVTSIGSNAFNGCTGLTSIEIPNSVTSIGQDAFSGCSGLTSVHIKDLAAWCKISFSYGAGASNPLSRAKHLFMNGNEVKDLVIPNSVTSIGDWAFYGCSGLTSVTIPNSVTSIGSNAFYNCSGLTSVHIKDLAAWCKISFSSGASNPLSSAKHLFMNGNEVKDLVIPNSVTSIGGYAFYGCSGLTSITIPSSVTSIGESAFKYCSGLTSIIVGSGNTKYDSRGNCNAIIETATNKLIKGCQNTIIPYSVTSIGESAFSDCSGLTSVTIPQSVTSIGNSVFSGCSGLTSVTIPQSVTSIGSNAFYNCSGLTSVTCEATSVPTTGYDVFYNVPRSSATLYIPASALETYKKTAPWSGFGTIKAIKYDGIYYEFDKTTKQATVISGDEKYTGIVNIPETVTYNGEAYSVTSIGYDAFYNCSGLTSVTIPNSVTSIGSSAFASCSSLTSIIIPNTVKSIGAWAFQYCSGLTSVTCEATSVPSTGSNVFGSVYLSRAMLYVPASALETYKKTEPWSSFGTIKVLEVSGSCGDNVYYTFNYPTGVLKITGTGSMTNYSSSSVPWYSSKSYIKVVEISDGVTSIGNYAFYECSGLTSVTIPNSVTSIGARAFQSCSDLTSVTIPNSVTSIGAGAFYDCSDLTSVTIPNSVLSIGSSAFQSCSGLTSITIPNSVTSIGAWAFQSCSGLTSITIPNSVISIGDWAFSGCSGLTKVVLNSNAIASKSYSSSSNLGTIFGSQVKEYIIGNNVTSIGENAFYGCSGLTSIEIPNSVTSIGNSAFSGCSGLTSIEIPNSVTSIRGGAFSGCSGLTSITIPNSVTSIGGLAFQSCSGLTSVTCEATSVPTTGYDVFYNVPRSSATLYIPASALETYKKTAPWSGFGNILALSEPLNYYDYGLTMKTLTDKAEWANIMKSAPNAVAVAEAELEEWAASQTNVIVKKNNSYYCPNFILTDLTEIAGSGYEKTGFYSPYDFTVKKGSYRRQAYAGYNTICVPFSFTASDLSGTAKTYAFEHYDDGEGKAIFKRVTGTIAAGTPCIVKESGNVVWNINLANKKISASSSSEDSHMRGTFVSTDVYQGKGYSPNSVNEFSPLSQYLHPFRACLILGSVSGARSIRLVLDDAVTDIDEVEVDSATLKNGKYLEKGKLVIYKSGRKYNANGSTIK